MIRVDWNKIGKGALMAAVGAGAVFGLEQLNLLDFGEYDVMVAGLVSVLANIVRKAFTPPA